MNTHNVKKGSNRINARAYGAVKNFEQKMIRAVLNETDGHLKERVQEVFGVFAASPKTDFNNPKHVNELILGSVYGRPYNNSRGVHKDLPAFEPIPLATSIVTEVKSTYDATVKLVYDMDIFKDFKLGHYLESYKKRIRIFFKNCVLTNFFRSSIDCQSENKVVLTLRMTLVQVPLLDLRKSSFVGSSEYHRFSGALESADLKAIKEDLDKMLRPKPNVVLQDNPDTDDIQAEFTLVDSLKQTKEKADKVSSDIISEISDMESQIELLEAKINNKRNLLNKLRIITDKSMETIELLGEE
ncbi:hypothetical protein TH2_110 [Shewanella phage Thanatos-2]|nr:hypothetical protein TH2_110 [Shewanella phage Thanatos-2]